MFILTREEIKYCLGIKKTGSTQNPVSGLLYNNRFFIKAKDYHASELENAIKDCRENFLDNEEVQIPTLMIKDDDTVSIWTQDNSYQIQNSSNDIIEHNSLSEVKQAKTINNLSLEKIVEKMRSKDGLKIKTRRYKLKLHNNCFIGKEAVDWLTQNLKISRKKAVKLGKELVKSKIIHHVHDEHDFEDQELFYRFYQDEEKTIWDTKIL